MYLWLDTVKIRYFFLYSLASKQYGFQSREMTKIHFISYLLFRRLVKEQYFLVS